MAIIVVGVNHKTAPIAVREQLAFAPQDLDGALQHFQHPAVDELVILSTCNRVEFYLNVRDTDAGCAACVEFIAAHHHLRPAQFVPHLSHWYDTEAVRHLFRVAASLDSMVLGEPQILGQVKAAYLAARVASRTGAVLTQLFERALGVGKRIRHETGINDHAVSVSYAAVELAKKIFESLRQRTVMVVGAGETAELAARHLLRQGVSTVFVVNRTLERTIQLAQTLRAKAIPWESLSAHLVLADIVISSTSAPHPVIGKAMVQEAMRARKGRPMFFIDIAVPRDIEPTVHALDGVFLYDIDALAHVVEVNRRERQREALVAEELVWREVQQFQRWLETRDAVPTIVALRQYAEKIGYAELHKTLAKLGPLDERQHRLIEELTTRIVNKFLHTPTVNLKRASRHERLRDDVALVRALFELDP
jgi:glutamyl-tRNA reductase